MTLLYVFIKYILFIVLCIQLLLKYILIDD